MNNTISLKENYMFRRIYAKGKSTAMPCCVVYVRGNASRRNRLGITVSGKLGNAVKRNKIRRRLREIYRTNEAQFLVGYDIIVVARQRSMFVRYTRLEREVLESAKKLGILRSDA